MVWNILRNHYRRSHSMWRTTVLNLCENSRIQFSNVIDTYVLQEQCQRHTNSKEWVKSCKHMPKNVWYKWEKYNSNGWTHSLGSACAHAGGFAMANRSGPSENLLRWHTFVHHDYPLCSQFAKKNRRCLIFNSWVVHRNQQNCLLKGNCALQG